MSFPYGSEARLDWNPGTDQYALRVFRRQDNGKALVTVLAGVDADGQPLFKEEEHEFGSLIPPLLVLPGEVYDALRRQLSDKTPVSEILAHRDDAIQVRDRLLSLIEKERA